jgi:protease IV
MRSMITGLALMGVAVAAEEKAPKPIVAVYDLEGSVSESGQVEGSLLGGSFSSDVPLTFLDVTASMAIAADDDHVKAVVVDIDDAELGIAQLQEIRDRLLELRDKGKDVWIFTDSLTNRTALLGSAANHFTLMPEGDVDFTGIHAESYYYKGLLDKAGVAADVIHIGDFKSYGEEFYRTGPSDYAKQQEDKLIGGIYDQLMGDIAEGRKSDVGEVKAFVDRGVFRPKEALEAKLVDQLMTRTEFSAAVKKAYPNADFDRAYEMPDYSGPEIKGPMDLLKLVFQSGKAKKPQEDYIALVTMEGEISHESIQPVRSEILKLVNDSHAKGLVLRVDSPGGSALESEVLWQATQEWKKTKRPFVVSMGEVAASGGYYISSGADKIYAEPGTLTGSIGVVGMKFVLAGAMEKLGLTTSVTSRGKNAGVMTMTRAYSPEEADLVRKSMEEVYHTFKSRVVAGRSAQLKGADLETLAGGRVYTGEDALKIGLVDEIGGLWEAICDVADETDLDPASVRMLPEPKSPLEGLFDHSNEKDNDDGELVRVGVQKKGSIVEAVRSQVVDAQFEQLPRPMKEAVQRALKRIQACENRSVQLLAPDLRIPLK